MSCLICGETVTILLGPGEWVFYGNGLAHRTCYEELMSTGTETIEAEI